MPLHPLPPSPLPRYYTDPQMPHYMDVDVVLYHYYSTTSMSRATPAMIHVVWSTLVLRFAR